MKLPSFLVGTGLFCIAKSAVTPHAIHERRDTSSSEWLKIDDKADGNAPFRLSIALAQRNLESASEYLMSISDPKSADYGKHWTAQQVADTFAPSDVDVNAVKSWLTANGIGSEKINVSKARNWMRLNVTVSEAAALLKTDYAVFEHQNTKKRALACDQYSLPREIKSLVDFITPTVHFPEVGSLYERDLVDGNLISSMAKFDGPVNMTTSPAFSHWDTSYCSNYSTPACIQALYNMPNGTKKAYVHFPCSYLANDLAQYFQRLGPQIPPATTPSVQLINEDSYLNSSDYLVVPEALMDLSLSMSLVYPQQVTMINSAASEYQYGTVKDEYDYVLEAYDASYCDIMGDKYQELTRTSTIDSMGACGVSKAPSVISVSYNGNEKPYQQVQQSRQCTESLKLGLQGVTVLYAAGDYGVAGTRGNCCVTAGCADKNSSKTAPSFQPSYPASCPWITSVGATQIQSSSSSSSKIGEVVAYEPKSATVEEWSSGGGFSNMFARPDYQKTALGYYFDHFSPNYTAVQYNNTKSTRGYPDISANGVNTLIVLKNKYYRTGGTSAATPIVGSIISLINEERLKVNKTVVGFINPVIYANPGAFNDIVQGNNPGCGTKGFQAVPGWDPVTGLGTPDYQKLLKVFMALP
ncbi:subtilisin-like protein [Mollisia scopiformis]|uniref:tripeptidyl-peptidase II n=1 Tax=Mollisia scopiformis TaxID=149040 RepID=A0A132B9X2_MOLSC|nr:subtilisin-like protein [Mollisia scopiformis]KUJ09206.1 subtilisin-like protein [Mollisia scopiformis]